MPVTAGRDTRQWTLLAVSVATFMTTLDNNVVNVALPSVQAELGLSITGLEWVVSSYLLPFAGLMLAGGRLADVYGCRPVFLAGVAVFTLASLLAGLSGTAALLIAGRAFQGVGAAMIAPAALAVLPAVFHEPRQRGVAVGVLSAVGALSLALGPPLGGGISQHWHWRWIFLINVPLGVATLVLAAVVMKKSDAAPARRRFDLPGLAASTTALCGLTYALIEGPARGWPWPPTVAGLVAVGAAVAFVRVERRASDPMVEPSLFGQRLFTGGVLVMGLWAFGVFGVYFFTSLYLQEVLGLSPTGAGAAFVPMALATAAIAVLSGPLAQRFGTRRIVVTGLALMSAALLGTASAGGDGGLAALMPWFLTYGVGAGLLVPLTGAIVEHLPLTRAGVASGVLTVSREVFGLLGITLLGAVLSTRRAMESQRGAGHPQAFLSGYELALLVAAVVVAAGVPIARHALRPPHRPPSPPARSEDAPLASARDSHQALPLSQE